MTDPVITPAVVGAAGSVASLGLKVYDDKLRRPLSLLSAWLRGKHLLLLGPSRAGKTRFWNYVKTGLLFPPAEDDLRTRQRTNAGAKRIVFNDHFHFDISVLDDSPGQDRAQDQVERARRENPHELILLIDASTDKVSDGVENMIQTEQWVKNFFSEFKKTWLHSSEGLSFSRIENISVLLNKFDLAEETVFQNREQAIRKIIQESLREALSESQIASIAIIRVALANTDKYKDTLAHAALQRIAYKSKNCHKNPLRSR